LGEWAGRVRPYCVIAVSVPNDMTNWRHALQILRGTSWHLNVHSNHVRFFNYTYSQKFMEESGVHVLKCKSVGKIPGHSLWPDVLAYRTVLIGTPRPRYMTI